MKITTWQARRNKKITLVELAKKTGLSKTTLNDIENEKLSPTMKQIEAIAKGLDMRINDLFESDYKWIFDKFPTLRKSYQNLTQTKNLVYNRKYKITKEEGNLMDYRKKIIKLLREIENEKYLKYLYALITEFINN